MERRKEPREPLPVAFAYSQRKDGNFHYEKAFALDVSKNGISFYSTEPMKKGTSLEILSEFFGKKPVKAAVKWSKREVKDTWRVGAQVITGGAG